MEHEIEQGAIRDLCDAHLEMGLSAEYSINIICVINNMSCRSRAEIFCCCKAKQAHHFWNVHILRVNGIHNHLFGHLNKKRAH